MMRDNGQPRPGQAQEADGEVPSADRRAWLRVGNRLRRLAAEPLVHFVAAGAVLFLAGRAYQVHTDVHRIVVTPQRVAQLANQYEMQFGVRPGPAALEAIVQADVKDEILFREGRGLKLDDGDEIVRRRLIQKMQFLMDDANAPAEPTPAQLRSFYQAHAERYRTPPTADFSHIYFAADDPRAEDRARKLLATLPASVVRDPGGGDPFPDLYDFSAADPDQVQRLFGRTAFAQAVFEAPPGQWVGPFRSGYGWHLLRVDGRRAPALPPLESVEAAVRGDYLRAAQDRANGVAFGKLSRGFTVVRADRPAGS